jgi:hypothetical protein
MTDEMFSFRAFTRLRQLTHLISTQQIDLDFYWRHFGQHRGREIS